MDAGGSGSSSGGGGSLWGTYDEAANAASFKEAVSSWRGGGEPEPEPEPEPELLTSPLEKVAAKSSCYGCFKLFATDTGVSSNGRAYCSDACAPAPAPAPAPAAGKPRRPVRPGERVCAREGCPETFASWKAVAVLSEEGPVLYCSDACVPAERDKT